MHAYYFSLTVTLPKRLIGLFETVYETDQSPPLRLGPLWKDIILDENIISLFFRVRIYSLHTLIIIIIYIVIQ
jgi:hypothetical protein